jgi:hypothetical protein
VRGGEKEGCWGEGGEVTGNKYSHVLGTRDGEEVEVLLVGFVRRIGLNHCFCQRTAVSCFWLRMKRIINKDSTRTEIILLFNVFRLSV